jgi:hypothetical protein
VSSGRLYISRDVVFDEDCFPYSVENPSSTPPELLAKILATPPLEPMRCSDASSPSIDVGLPDSHDVCTDLASQPIFPVSPVQVTRSGGAEDPARQQDPCANPGADASSSSGTKPGSDDADPATPPSARMHGRASSAPGVGARMDSADGGSRPVSPCRFDLAPCWSASSPSGRTPDSDTSMHGPSPAVAVSPTPAPLTSSDVTLPSDGAAAAPDDAACTNTSPPRPATPSAPAHHMRTRLRNNIHKELVRTDGTVPYDPRRRGFSAVSAPPTEPDTLEDALADKNWTAAMHEEYQALLRNQTWHLVPPSSGRNLIDCRWVFKLKHRADCRRIHRSLQSTVSG